MRINIIGFSSKGCALAKKIAGALDEHECLCFGKTIADRHGAPQVRSMDSWTEGSFRTCDAIIFIGAAGIAVRHIAPYIKDKTKDPAIIVIDELGKNIIPILSGHIGGANRISKAIGERIGGNVVITTATDLNDVFAVDTFAADNGMYIRNMQMAKQISARLLDGKTVCLRSDTQIEGELPKGIAYAEEGDAGIYITTSARPGPFKRTLKLIPRNMTIGVGCHRDIDPTVLEKRILDVLRRNDISIHAIRAGGSIDLKKDEKGMLDFFRKYDIPLTFFSSEELAGIEGEFTASEYVRSITGVENVCERSAVAVSENGKIIVKKDAGEGVTVAGAKEDRTISFGDAR